MEIEEKMEEEEENHARQREEGENLWSRRRRRRRLGSSVAWDKTNTKYLQNQKLPISFPFQANERNGIQCNVFDQF